MHVTLFSANCDPLFPFHALSHIPGPPKYVTHLGPPIFSRPSTKIPDKSPCTNSLSIVRGGFVRGVFCLEGFVRVGFCPFPLRGVPEGRRGVVNGSRKTL